MLVDGVHEVISFRQSKWLAKNKSANTQKMKRALNGFEKRLL